MTKPFTDKLAAGALAALMLSVAVPSLAQTPAPAPATPAPAPATPAPATPAPATPEPAAPAPAPAPATPAPAAPEPTTPAPATPAPAPAPEPAPAAPTPAAPEAPVPETPSPAASQPASAPQPATDATVGADWPYYGGDANAHRFSPLTQITPENVGELERVFTYNTGDLPSEGAENSYAPETTPLKLGDNLYMCSAKNILISVNAATGTENWRYDPQVPNEAIPYSASCRGVAVYEDPQAAEGAACATRIIEGTLDARLIAVDAATGQPCADFGQNGQVDLWVGIGEKVPGWYAVTAAPAVVRGVIVTGAQVKDGQAEDAPSGVVRGFDARTGALLWAWDLGAADANRAGPPEGGTYTRGTPNMWTTAVWDEQLGLVYLPLGNSSVDYYGSNRTEAENRYATSLVALDATTGEERWTFQTVRRDVWDYDLGSQPSLIDFPGTDGATTPAILLASKQGDIYILDRATGEPLTPVEELQVPTEGGVEPDYMSATQPSSAYHTLRKPDLTERSMWGFSPIDQMFCRIWYRQARYDGYFTPPTSDQYWIQYPGYNGGNDWGSVAIDPGRGLIIANYNDIPNHNRLVPREEAEERGLRPIYEIETGGEAGGNAEGAGDPQVGSPYAIDVNAGWRSPLTQMPCTQPPYGGIRAIELATGRTVWDKPLGTARRNGPWGIPSFLPLNIGTPNNGGSVVTAGGVTFIGAATDNLFRAIDTATGEVLWSDVLPAGGQANPISYEVGGRQFVLIAPGGHHFMETGVSDEIIVYALPE